VRTDQVSRAAAEPFIGDLLAEQLDGVREVRVGAREVRDGRGRAAAGTHADPQNVHLSSHQKSLRLSVRALRALPRDDDDDALLAVLPRPSVVGDARPRGWLTRRFGKKDGGNPDAAARVAARYLDGDDRHAELGLTYRETLLLVLNAARGRPDVMDVLRDEIVAGDGLCFTGRVTRLVNALSGFVDGVGVHLSPAEELANAVLALRRRLVAAHGDATDAYLAHALHEVAALLRAERPDMPDAECEAWLDAL